MTTGSLSNSTEATILSGFVQNPRAFTNEFNDLCIFVFVFFSICFYKVDCIRKLNGVLIEKWFDLKKKKREDVKWSGGFTGNGEWDSEGFCFGIGLSLVSFQLLGWPIWDFLGVEWDMRNWLIFLADLSLRLMGLPFFFFFFHKYDKIWTYDIHFMIIALYYQVKISISFWYRQDSNSVVLYNNKRFY